MTENKPEEKLWIQAKSIARTKNRSMDWAFIMDIYKRIGGHTTRVFFQDIDKQVSRLIGVYTDYQDLIITDGELHLMPHEEVLTKKKLIDKEGSSTYTLYDTETIPEEVIGELITKGYKDKKIKIYD